MSEARANRISAALICKETEPRSGGAKNRDDHRSCGFVCELVSGVELAAAEL